MVLVAGDAEPCRIVDDSDRILCKLAFLPPAVIRALQADDDLIIPAEVEAVAREC
jgi:hypothetical protein